MSDSNPDARARARSSSSRQSARAAGTASISAPATPWSSPGNSTPRATTSRSWPGPRTAPAATTAGMYCPDFAIYGVRWKDVDSSAAGLDPLSLFAHARIPKREETLHADPKGVLTGVHFMDGDHAACEGALAAGAASSPAIPSRPPPRSSSASPTRIPTVGGLFIQMEDELAATIAIQGAVWGGQKVMNVTRPRLLPDDGAPRLRLHDRDAHACSSTCSAAALPPGCPP